MIERRRSEDPRSSAIPTGIHTIWGTVNSTTIILAVIGLIGTWMTTKSNGSNLDESYSKTADAVNHLQRQVTRLDEEVARCEERDGLSPREGREGHTSTRYDTVAGAGTGITPRVAAPREAAPAMPAMSATLPAEVSVSPSDGGNLLPSTLKDAVKK
jgi:hypothetical protein